MRTKFIIGFVLILIEVIGIYIVLGDERAVLVHPKGTIAHQELNLIVFNIALMLVIIIPTYLLLFAIVWRYGIKNENVEHNPDHHFGILGQVMMWGLPTIIVVIMAIVNWEATHQLDPYKRLEMDAKPLTIQVVALDWKWLFIYPELGIATLNYFHIPEKTPIHLRLTADGAPMNSFWIPQLSGQIYSMTGMSTQLNLMAYGEGNYKGRAVEINGDGYADMTFPAKSSSHADFENWIKEVKQSPERLTQEAYSKLVKPNINKSITFYSEVEKDLYHKIVHKYMYPTHKIL